MTSSRKHRLLIAMLMATCSLRAADTTTAKISVTPSITKAIQGESNLDRQKYFNLATHGNNFERTIDNATRIDYYLNDLGMSFGRNLGGVYSEVRWGNSVFEDPDRPGYINMYRFEMANKIESKGSYTRGFEAQFAPNLDVALHDRRSAYPDFMGKYYTSSVGEDHSYPQNLDAATELAVAMLNHNFNDFTRPGFYEIVNEPHWSYPGDQHFADLHTKLCDAAKQVVPDVKIGGPCSSVAYYYRKNYANLSHFTQFIDNTDCKLDFYSFHVYDYMRWNNSRYDFTGRVTTGLPLDGVLDALNNYTVNEHGKEIKMVVSEHGGYISDETSKQMVENIARSAFPGSGFEWEMQMRSIHNYIKVSSSIANTMTFMNHPHMILKSVPFILLESFGWDPKYMASLLVANEFSDKSNWVESKLIDFYRFFAGVEGRRVQGFCDDPDLQFHTFVNGKTVIIVMNNMSSDSEPIQIDLPDQDQISKITVRRLGRRRDFRPEFSEETIASLDDLSLAGREAMVLFVDYKKSIRQASAVNEVPHYGDRTSQYIASTDSFSVNIPDAENVQYAILRLSLDRPSGSDYDLDVRLNGTEVVMPIEDSAWRFEDDDSYASLKYVQVDPELLTKDNVVTVSWKDRKRGGIGSVVIRAAYTTEIEQPGEVEDGKKFSLFPNPFNTSINILIHDTGESGNTNIEIFDVLGRCIQRISKSGGDEEAYWDGRAADGTYCANGIYWIRVKGDNYTKTERVTLLR